jgi:hypothetical protein
MVWNRGVITVATEKITIHFVCEGSAEAHYINKLLQQPFNIDTDHPEYFIQQAEKAEGTAPIEVLDEAIEKCDKNPLAYCYCIIDGDGEFKTNPPYRQAFIEKWNTCEYKDKIKVVFNNPALELWFAWHLPYFTYTNQTGNELKQYLNKTKEFEGYKSGRVNYEILYNKTGLNQAAVKSRQYDIEDLKSALLNNTIPYSNFHDFIETFFRGLSEHYPYQEFKI